MKKITLFVILLLISCNQVDFNGLIDEEIKKFEEVPPIVAAPTPYAPSNAGIIATNKPVFKWNASNSAESYRLEVADNSNFNQLLVKQEGLTELQYELIESQSLPDEGVFYWRIISVADDGRESDHAVFIFSVDISLPDIGASVDKDEVYPGDEFILTFTSSESGTYIISKSQSVDFSDEIILKSGVINESQINTEVAIALIGEDLYTDAVNYLKVKVLDSGNNTGEDIISIVSIVNVASPAPGIYSPANAQIIANNMPQFKWSASAGAVKYELEISENSEFSSLVLNKIDLTGLEYTIVSGEELSTSGIYYWRVFAVNAQGIKSTSSSVYLFQTDMNLPSITLNADEANVFPDEDITLTWQSSETGTYIISKSDSSDFSDESILKVGTVDLTDVGNDILDVIPGSDLFPDSLNYIRVKVIDDADNEGFDTVSVTRNELETISASITSHLDNAYETAGTINLSGTAQYSGGSQITTDSFFTWSSSISGDLGTGRNISPTVAEGQHTVTLTVTDNDSRQDVKTVVINVGASFTDDFSTDTNIDESLTTAKWNNDLGYYLLQTHPYTFNSSYEIGTVHKYDSWNIKISGNYAYVANFKEGLVIFDISDPNNIAQVGFWSDNAAKYVLIDGSRAYITTDESFYIIDISDPANPVTLGSHTHTKLAKAIAVKDNYAYVSYIDGVFVFDISNPAFIHQVSQTYNMIADSDIAISGNYLFVLKTDSNMMKAYDISDPDPNPAQINEGLPRKGSIGFPGINALRIIISDNKAYLLDESQGFSVVDISTVPDEGNSFPVLGSSGYGGSDIFLDGSFAYIAGDELRKLDISDVSNITYINSSDYSGFPKGVSIKENFSYIADEVKGLVVINLYSDPQIISSISLTSYTIGFSGNYAFSSYGILSTLDISNPFSPVKINDYDPYGGSAQDMCISGNTAYFASGWVAGLVSVDISDPLNPADLDFCDNSGDYCAHLSDARAVVVRGSYAYVADDHEFVIVDVSSPDDLREVSYLDLPDTGSNRNIVLSENYAIVSNSYTGFYIIDITDSMNPVKLCQYASLYSGYYVAVKNDYLYLLKELQGLYVFNISDPANPTEVGQYIPTGDPKSVTISGNYAYLLDSTDGVTVLNLIDPENPVAERIVNEAQGTEIKINNNFVYILGDEIKIMESVQQYENLYSTDIQTIESVSITSSTVKKIKIETTTIDAGGISYQFTNNGQDWYYINEGVMFEFPSTPNGTLKWRATLQTTTKMNSPVLNDITINYWEN